MGPKLQSMGAEGWELVSVSSYSDICSVIGEYGGYVIAGITTAEAWVFKRPIE